MKILKDMDITGKRVLVRADLNVPVKDGEICDKTRISAFLPTLEYLLENKAKIIVMTHFGRPKGKVVEKLRVNILAEALSVEISRPVIKLDDCIGDDVKTAVKTMADTDIIMLENTRFHPEEKKNGPEFAKELASLADIFVNDAFGAIHRVHASTVGVAQLLPSCAGLLVEKEFEALSGVFENAKHPVCLIMGGAKIDTKIGVLMSFLDKADYFLIGGALANTFLAAEGYEVGTSLCQHDKIKVAQDFLLAAELKRKFVYLPKDVVVADEISVDSVDLDLIDESVTSEMKILDIGRLTTETFVKCIAEAETIIWNGPMGLYEFSQFSDGTKLVAEAIANSDAVSLVGGGDSIDAINKFGLDITKFTHISTGGGAMLEFLEGKELLGLKVLD